MALEITGLTVTDLTEARGQIVNPEQGLDAPLFVEVLTEVAGALRFASAPGLTPEAHNIRMAALRDALEAEYGPGVMRAGMGCPESPEHPLKGHFCWTLSREALAGSDA